jgi:hypothetical protein
MVPESSWPRAAIAGTVEKARKVRRRSGRAGSLFDLRAARSVAERPVGWGLGLLGWLVGAEVMLWPFSGCL